MPRPEADIRPLASRAEYAACVELQREVWGAGFADVVPPTILMVAQRLGGVAAGAFDGAGRLLGFVFGLTGLGDDGEPMHWSDMLAVRPEARGAGLGKRLKLFQRDRLLERGVRRMQWTYDPLVARNANLNLNGLGAAAVEYVVDLYGDTGSALHAGLATDRFIVEWRLDAAAPPSRRAGGAVVGPAGAEAAHADADASALPTVDLSGADADASALPTVDLAGADAGRPLPAMEQVRVAAPADIEAVKAADPARARAWRAMQRRAFTHYLDRGYRVSGFVHAPPPRDSHYLVTRSSLGVQAARVDAADVDAAGAGGAGARAGGAGADGAGAGGGGR